MLVVKGSDKNRVNIYAIWMMLKNPDKFNKGKQLFLLFLNRVRKNNMDFVASERLQPDSGYEIAQLEKFRIKCIEPLIRDVSASNSYSELCAKLKPKFRLFVLYYLKFKYFCFDYAGHEDIGYPFTLECGDILYFFELFGFTTCSLFAIPTSVIWPAPSTSWGRKWTSMIKYDNSSFQKVAIYSNKFLYPLGIYFNESLNCGDSLCILGPLIVSEVVRINKNGGLGYAEWRSLIIMATLKSMILFLEGGGCTKKHSSSRHFDKVGSLFAILFMLLAAVGYKVFP